MKQQDDDDWKFKVESLLMRRIMDSTGGIDHVVKLYKGYHLNPGVGTHRLDPSPFDAFGVNNQELHVSRLYMEYYAGGDLDAITEHLPIGQRWQEEEIWRLFECLARGLLILENGSEDPAAAPWTRKIAHFDIKPQNSKS